VKNFEYWKTFRMMRIILVKIYVKTV